MAIHIGIGALTKKEIEGLLADGHTVIRYDPRKSGIYSVSHDRLVQHQRAVSSFSESRIFREKGNGSTICDNFYSEENVSDHYEPGIAIDTISLSAILHEQIVVDTLYLDCEGTEFDLLMNTPIHSLVRCHHIWVEFHNLSKILSFEREDVDKILVRLAPYFSYIIENEQRPDIMFTNLEL